MRSTRRFAAAIVLAGALGAGLTLTTPAAASTVDRPMVVATVTPGQFCAALADAIEFLEGRPASRLRDFLLEQARQIFARHCS